MCFFHLRVLITAHIIACAQTLTIVKLIIKLQHSCTCHGHVWHVDTAPGKNSQKTECVLTHTLRRPCIHAVFFSTACRTACKHALRVFDESCRMPCQHATRGCDKRVDHVYKCRCFSESEGTRFGAPGYKALPSRDMSEWIFA